ncbi:TetR/AcrR family transcriptional regulator C-terminal ligand-binding domain-containing protein [Nocardia sp. NPDC051929]|uniref:TetR/AcrR family transcriptional regulator n=1 Tax=unclassified Nocardia TaxID=2637762 RepID=UPI0034478629
MDLLMASDTTAITMEALATAAGVSKQTIYRWWPNKASVVAEALSERARARVPTVDTGSVLGDMTAFLQATFKAANSRPVARALRTLLAEAQTDSGAAEILHTYTDERRQALAALLQRGQQRGELGEDIDLPLIIDQAFGFVWYRLAVRHATLDRSAAIALSENLLPGTHSSSQT